MEMIKQFIRFAGVGLIGTSAHYLVLVSLVQFGGGDSVWASDIGFVVGALVNYHLNYIYTFRSNKCHREAMLKFFSVATVGLMLNSIVMTALTKELSLHYLFSQLAATGLVLVWNFAGNRFWTFREKQIETKR